MSILNQISQLEKILILGFAREGQSTHKFLSEKFPHLGIDTADKKDGSDYLSHLTDYSLVVKTPGIPPHLPEIVSAKNQGVVFTSQTQIFFEQCPGRIIGITGTKGKSTTASVIYHVLHENQVPSVLVGNIGRPMLDYLPDITKDTWVVAELSSYQLMDLTLSPHIAVMQAVYPDHLDYHQTFDEYFWAKQNIARFQKPDDYFLFNTDNAYSASTAQLTPATKIPFAAPAEPIPTHLLGVHNQLNIQPAIIIGKLLKIPEDRILSAIGNFLTLGTRLESLGTHQGITFYADTLATIPEAAIAAIDALSSEIETLVAGGHDRKQNYSGLAQKILDTGIKNLILFPATGPRIWEEILKINPSPPVRQFTANSMPEAVRLIYQNTSPGKAALLSPAAPSFTLFKDYMDEYSQFKNCITDFASQPQS